MSNWDVVKDPYIGLLPNYEGELQYGPAVWGPFAYQKSFEKFWHSQPMDDIKGKYPVQWNFALWALKREYSFLRNSTIIPMVSTDKNMESTPAFPKAEFYGSELEYIEDFGFEPYICEYNRVKSGARPTPLWYLFLKKETLKQQKIDESDIRQILCTDPAFNRIGLMFEQDQNDRMKDLTETHFGQCGWTPFYGGWDSRMKRLARSGNKYIEMDWSRYDGTIPPEVFLAIKEVRFQFLSREYRTQENKDIYNWYCRNLLKRIVLLPSGEITEQVRGNPSGQVSTTMDNNMVNTFLQAFEFIYINKLTIDQAKEAWDDYDTIVYGDDRITSSPLIPDTYESDVIAMYDTIFGMWVKPGNVKVTSTLDGVSFCGFTNIVQNGLNLPVPTNVMKLVSNLVKPTTRLPDVDALVGKVISLKILMHNLPDSDPGKQFILACELSLKKHLQQEGRPMIKFTSEMLDFLWRGGPKKQ